MNIIIVDGPKVHEIIRSKLEITLPEIELSDDRIAVLLPRINIIKKDKYIDLDQLPNSIREIVGDQIGTGKICVSYVDEIKGIEFDKVFVVVNGLSNNEKYIAFTMALSDLTTEYDDIEEYFKELEEKKGREV